MRLHAEWVPVPDADLLAARVAPWAPLPAMAGRTPPGLPADLEARLPAGR